MSDVPTDLERRLEALEDRLGQAEDRLEIQQVIARYGPAVDSLSADRLGALWSDDAVYDIGDESPRRSREGIVGLLTSSPHESYVSRGCAHVLSLPVIELDGRRAVAVNYSTVFVRTDGRWRAERVSANRWQLVRTSEGWRVERRTTRLLDGDAAARDLL